MDTIKLIIQLVRDHGGDISVAAVALMVAFGGFLKALEAILQIIAPLTPWKWDENLATLLGKWTAAKVFQKKDVK